MPRRARRTQRAGTLLAIIVFVDETVGMYTYQAETPFRSWGSILSRFHFLADHPIFLETLYIVYKQGGIDERSNNSVVETIDSIVYIANICTGVRGL
jgi:hypothetical protein